MFTSFLKDKKIKNFIKNYNSINHNNAFCGGNILGISQDHQHNIITEKLYFSTTRYLSKSEIEQILPSSKELINCYKFVNFNKDTICKRGVTFAIKKEKGNIKTQFHFKVDPKFYNNNIFQKYKLNSINNILNGDEEYGMSFEYKNEKPFLKKYIYIKNNKSKIKFLEMFNLKNTFYCDTIEYTETEEDKKVIFIGQQDKSYFKFKKLNSDLIYKNYGLYLTKDEQTAYIYPRIYEQLEKTGLIDTISFL